MIQISASVLFIVEGVGKILPANITAYLYIFLLGLINLYILIKKKPIFFPKLSSVFFGIFIIFSLTSTIFHSIDKQVSFELTLFYAVSYLIFVFFYNYKDLGKKYLNILILIGSLIFTAFYLFHVFLGKGSLTAYQMVTTFMNNSHNHLGDFLGLGLVVFVYNLLNNEKAKLSNWLVVFFPFFFLSFSRSAFLALIIVYLLILVKNNKKKLFSFKSILSLILIATTMILFFSTVREVSGKNWIGKINQYLSGYFNLQTKEFTAGRIAYWKQGITSFYKQPLFGVGPGNFGYLSKKYTSADTKWYNFGSTETAHSLLLEILFESGLLAFIFFTGFIILIIISIFKSNKLEGYLLLYLFLNFQTDYTYRIYSMFVLFMVLGAIVYEEKTLKVNRTFIYNLLSVGLLLIAAGILTSKIFLRLNKPGLSLTFYSLNKDAYRETIIQDTAKKGCSETEKYSKNYYFVSPGYLPTLQLLSNYHEACGNKKMAIKMLDKAVEDNRFISFEIVKKNYLLKKELYGKKEATAFLGKVLRGYGNLRYLSSFRKQISDFCRKNKEYSCGKIGWW